MARAWRTSNCGTTTKCFSTPWGHGAFPTRRRPATSAAASGPATCGTLSDVFHQVRRKVWAQQPAEFFAEAKIDVDGTLVATTGQCKAGRDIAYNGTWGYHALVVSLANTGEVLSIVNRSGNRPSHEGAAEEIDRVLTVCFDGGFCRVLVRGDTDFTQSKHLDRWDDDQRVRFIFGVDCLGNLLTRTDDLPENAWKALARPLRYQVKTKPRARPRNVKERIVRERGFKNIRLESEDAFVRLPCQIVRTSRRIVYRLLAWNRRLDVFFRLVDQLHRPLRC